MRNRYFSLAAALMAGTFLLTGCFEAPTSAPSSERSDLAVSAKTAAVTAAQVRQLRIKIRDQKSQVRGLSTRSRLAQNKNEANRILSELNRTSAILLRAEQTKNENLIRQVESRLKATSSRVERLISAVGRESNGSSRPQQQ
jgi:hypothetical protein